jgi:nucleoid-associated protein YgaU
MTPPVPATTGETALVTTTFTRAYLQIEGQSDPLYCWFNPTTLVRNRRSKWKEEVVVAKSAQKPAYLGGKGDDITLDLLLHADSTQSGSPVQSATNRTGADVQANIDALFALLDASQPGAKLGQARPPTVTLHWGKFVSAESVARSVNVTIELFDADGTPLRARVGLSLAQYEPEPGQATPDPVNPTTRATQRRRAHKVEAGENIHLIAFAHLRSPARWHEIAAANGLDDPLAIAPGQVLVVPMEDA